MTHSGPSGNDSGKGKGKGKGKGADGGKGPTPKAGGQGGKGGGKGGSPTSQFPCYEWFQHKCTRGDACTMNHRPPTEAERPKYNEWKERQTKKAQRSPSPGAAATGACPAWVATTCLLGKDCPLEHNGQSGDGKAKSAAKAAAKVAKAKAAAGP